MTKQYTYSRGSHLYVDFWSDVKIFDRQEVCLIAWLSLLKLIFTGQRSECSHAFLIFAVQRWPWSLDQHLKGFDHLIQFWSRSQTPLHGTYKWQPLDTEVLQHYIGLYIVQLWVVCVSHNSMHITASQLKLITWTFCYPLEFILIGLGFLTLTLT